MICLIFSMKHKELTEKIIGCAMKVHTSLGNGFQEVIYQRALEIEFRNAGLGYAREMEMIIYYDGEDIGTRRVDFFVEDVIMVELKAIISKSLQFKRVHNNKIL
jgi:GxxExxY protein